MVAAYVLLMFGLDDLKRTTCFDIGKCIGCIHTVFSHDAFECVVIAQVSAAVVTMVEHGLVEVNELVGLVIANRNRQLQSE